MTARDEPAAKDDVVDLLDYASARLVGRAAGLTDAEYLWEPVPGCWTVRVGADGRRRPDRAVPPPEPAPVTTIAWVVVHLTEVAPATGTLWPLLVPGAEADVPHWEPPATADEAVARLEEAARGWHEAVASIPPALLVTPLGDLGRLAHEYGGGAYAGSTGLALVLHAVDEHIHHGSQVGTLRDLWAHTPDRAGHRSPAHPDPLVDAVLRGDESTTAAILADPSEVDRARRAHPDAVARAVAIGGAPAVRRLLDLGFPLDPPGPIGSLHLAAGYGEREVADVLLAAGADRHATDGMFHTTPAGWARYLGEPGLAAALDGG